MRNLNFDEIRNFFNNTLLSSSQVFRQQNKIHRFFTKKISLLGVGKKQLLPHYCGEKTTISSLLGVGKKQLLAHYCGSIGPAWREKTFPLLVFWPIFW